MENMSKKINLLIFSLIFLFAILPIVSSVNLDISVPTNLGNSYGTFKAGTNITLLQTCTNLTDFCDECNLTSLKFDGDILTIVNVGMTRNTALFNYTLTDIFTQQVGHYTVTGFCIGGGVYSPFAYTFETNRTGQAISSEMIYIYIALLFVLIFFLTMSIIGFINFNNLLAKVGLFGFSYLLLIAITFVGWNVANDFIITNSFIIDFMRILFIVLVIGIFPLVIGAFAWYVIMLFKIKEIERLMDKGMSYEEAEHRQGRKYK